MSTNSDEHRKTIYRTEYGHGLLLWRKGLLVGHRLPSVDIKVETYKQTRGNDSGVPRGSRQLAADLQSYFRGENTDFAQDRRLLDLFGWTAFERSVTEALWRVPHGSLISYAALAEAAGHPGAQRAVGNLMARNPFPLLIPCHRVVRSDGRLGGFSAGNGWKERLTAIEGSRPKAFHTGR